MIKVPTLIFVFAALRMQCKRNFLIQFSSILLGSFKTRTNKKNDAKLMNVFRVRLPLFAEKKTYIQRQTCDNQAQNDVLHNISLFPHF